MIDLDKIYTSNNSGDFKVTSYVNHKSITVEFLATGYRIVTNSSNIRKGKVKDKLRPSVFGVGFIGEGKYKPSHNGITSKEYESWCDMMRRCYDSEFHKRHPTYSECKVDPLWHNFQSFADWHKANYKDGLHLDKDIKVKGNKIYGPDFCKFVTAKENAIESSAKHFIFKSPKGEKVGIYNLTEFCNINGLTQSHMSSVSTGKRKSHQGWTKYTYK